MGEPAAHLQGSSPLPALGSADFSPARLHTFARRPLRGPLAIVGASVERSGVRHRSQVLGAWVDLRKSPDEAPMHLITLHVIMFKLTQAAGGHATPGQSTEQLGLAERSQ